MNLFQISLKQTYLLPVIVAWLSLTDVQNVFLKNWPCQARVTLVNINSNETIYYPFTISGNKFGRSCNTVEDRYGWICVLNKVKNMNLYKFNSMLHLNETRFSVQLELSEWKCRLNENVHIQNNNRIMVIVGRTEDN